MFPRLATELPCAGWPPLLLANGIMDAFLAAFGHRRAQRGPRGRPSLLLFGISEQNGTPRPSFSSNLLEGCGPPRRPRNPTPKQLRHATGGSRRLTGFRFEPKTQT